MSPAQVGCRVVVSRWQVTTALMQLAVAGQCWDNALAESFFGSIKGELIDLQPWPTGAGARRATFTQSSRWCR